MDLSENIDIANTIADGCVTNKTKSQYQNKIRRIQEWYTKNNLQFSLPLNEREIKAYFGYLVTTQLQNPAFSTVSLYRSAIKRYYKQHNLKIEDSLNIAISNFLQGYQRKVADLKIKGEMNIREGKYPISFLGYRIISNKLLLLAPEKVTNNNNSNSNNSNSNDNSNNNSSKNTWHMLFAWPFFVLQWNLMARSNTVASIMLQHITWEDDSLVITTPKHKGDQEGAYAFPKHIYANPLEPSICPILSLAILIFCRSFSCNNQLFTGKDQETRFSKLLQRVLHQLNENESNQLGSKIEDIGTHSARKGAPSYCSGMIGGPNVVQIYLRAGWSLGQVQDRYLFSGNGGDQFTGRVVCGLPNTTLAFATLPPHFVDEFDISKEEWGNILPNYDNIPKSCKQVLLFLLASIVHHHDWLKLTLRNDHPLFTSFLYSSGNINKYFQYLATPNNSKLRPTGIPPHLTIVNELKTCKDEIYAQRQDMPALLTNEIRNKFKFNGNKEITFDKMQELIGNMMQQIKQQFSSTSQLISNNINANNSSTNNNYTLDSRFSMFIWKDGSMHMVPEGFIFPTHNTKDLWNLWWFGHIANRIQPYRRLTAQDLRDTKEAVQLTKAKKVIFYIEQVAITRGYIDSNKKIEHLTKDESSKVFDLAFTDLLKTILQPTAQNRLGEISIATIYDHLPKPANKKRKLDATNINTSTVIV
ncbi:MAG: hypothetical protein ACXW2E_12335 [Nitrososphaeraceae archaeon]